MIPLTSALGVPPRLADTHPNTCVSRSLDPMAGGAPFTRVDLIFDQPVIIPPGAIRASTTTTNAFPITVAPEGVPTTTATVTFAAIEKERLLLVADFAITNVAGEPLDGEILDPRAPALDANPSGDGRPGGQAVLEFHVLQGDVTCDGVITISDSLALAIATAAGCDDTHPDWDPRADLDTNGCIDLDDFAILNASSGNIPQTDNDPPDLVAATPDRLPLPGPEVVIEFDEPIDPTSITSNSLFAVGDDGKLVQAGDPVTTDGMTFTFKFDDLPSLQDYEFTLSNAVRDLSGELAMLTTFTIPGTDTDGDGIDDDGDRSGVIGDAPCTTGSFIDCDDNCPLRVNTAQQDTDFDGAGDVCDVCVDFDDFADADTDGLPDGCDNCPFDFNPAQTDSDQDANGDACDLCPGSSDLADRDQDGAPDDCDNCPNFRNRSQADSDGDGVGDDCDNCPNAFNPGQEIDPDFPAFGAACSPGGGGGGGGGFPDQDGDGVSDVLDQCPDTPEGETVDPQGCAFSQLDADGDGVPNGIDQCPDTPADEVADEVGCSESQREPEPTPPPNGEEPQPTPPPNGEEPGQPTPTPTPTPEPPDDEKCGCGAPCGVLGVSNVYFLMLGMAAMKRRTRGRLSAGLRRQA